MLDWIKKHRGILAYLLLVGVIAYSFWDDGRERDQRRADIVASIAVNCERLNVDADEDATAIYTNYKELEENAKLLGIEVTPELRKRAIRNANRSLARIIKYDCTRSPFEAQRIIIYKPIVKGKPIPTIKDTTTRIVRDI